MAFLILYVHALFNFIQLLQNIQPTGQRFLLALDVSASMRQRDMVAHSMTPAVAAAAMLMVTLKVEAFCTVMAFHGNFEPLDLKPNMTLPEVVEHTKEVSKPLLVMNVLFKA